MGGCNSRIIPIATLPPPTDTDSRSVSYDTNDIVGHILAKKNLYDLLKSEFDTYKRNTRAIERVLQTNQVFRLTSYSYDMQERVKERFKNLLKEAKKFGEILVIQTYSDNMRSYENIYKGYLLYMYKKDKIIIDDDLLFRSDICDLFDIKRKNSTKKISWNPIPIIHNIRSDEPL